jgi:bacterioferritin
MLATGTQVGRSSVSSRDLAHGMLKWAVETFLDWGNRKVSGKFLEETGMASQKINNKAVIGVLNQILEMELAGVVRYTHYSLMVFGYNRIPIVAWLRSQATEALVHAHQAGEWVTTLNGHPSLAVGSLLETHKHNIGQILQESYDVEKAGWELYVKLLDLVKDRHVALEEYAREMIYAEEIHLSEVEKMLRNPDKG